MPKINQEEYEVLKGLDDKWKWIARNYNGALITYTDKPMKKPNLYWDSFGERMDDRLFQFIQWGDEEPYEIAELIEEYEYSTEHVSHVVNERVRALGKAWSESEETEVKDIEWLKEEILTDMRYLEGNREIQQLDIKYQTLREVAQKINSLEEPETLSQEFIDEHKENWQGLSITGYSVPEKDLQNLLVPKQEEVDRAYKDGYEKGKEHATEKQSEETETVARVLVDYLIASAKLKLVLSMEVEELEE